MPGDLRSWSAAKSSFTSPKDKEDLGNPRSRTMSRQFQYHLSSIDSTAHARECMDGETMRQHQSEASACGRGIGGKGELTRSSRSEMERERSQAREWQSVAVTRRRRRSGRGRGRGWGVGPGGPPAWRRAERVLQVYRRCHPAAGPDVDEERRRRRDARQPRCGSGVNCLGGRRGQQELRRRLLGRHGCAAVSRDGLTVDACAYRG
jgi:hypothetical protein